MKKLPKRLAYSERRKALKKKGDFILKEMSKALPVSKAYAMGSFLTAKKNPYDIDFAILVKVPFKSKMKNWSVDLVLAPDNKYGAEVLKELKLWMKKKYSNKTTDFLRLK